MMHFLMTFSFLPEQASSLAAEVDHLFFFLTGISLFFAVLIYTLIAVFIVRYRRKKAGDTGARIEGNIPLEITWSAIPLVIALTFFALGAALFFKQMVPPHDAMEVFVVGKQWMWKIQHPEGKREINELHVPVGRPVKLKMTSEDVIHSFFVPAFRIKMDVVPGRYTQTWFEATKPGTYHLFCTEYCGTKHSQMIGKVIAMPESEYQAWLEIGQMAPASSRGEALFREMRCISCHNQEAETLGPNLRGIWEKPVTLTSGRTLIRDEDYLRESILNPHAKLRQGFGPIMPSYQSQLSESQIIEIISYIKSLSKDDSEEVSEEVPAPEATAEAQAGS